MLTVAEAQELIVRHTRSLPAEMAGLSPALLGRRLAEDVVSDLDSPGYDKSTVDGYALRSADLSDGRATLVVVEEIPAGRVPTIALKPGQASRIMTGAPIPTGADAVVPVEQTQSSEDRVEITARVSPGGNILPRGREMKQGQVILSAGKLLGPVEVGVLGTVGRTSVPVVRIPTVAVLSTGDEVVEPSEVPGPGQLRNSNGPMLQALAARDGARPRYLGIARDTLDSLRTHIREGLLADVLLLSGGVSMGTRDLVPAVLKDEGVVTHFHKVAMKPGKPVVFGTIDFVRPGAPAGRAKGRTLVFGLPGNPVSSLACHALFVRAALRRLSGHPDPLGFTVSARLAEDFPYRTDRPTYHPALLDVGEVGWRVRVVSWAGSADLLGLTRANALVLVPAGDHVHRAGAVHTVVRLD
jgi:molybdopterin molybdotransferase